jgi:SAM-dependent methyltransferase
LRRDTCNAHVSTFRPPPWGRLAACAGLAGPLFGGARRRPTRFSSRLVGRRPILTGLASRVATRVGDLRTDGLGEGFDLVLVSAICHMLGPDENRDLLRRCRQALAAGGRVVVQDFILEQDKTAPKMAAVFSLNMLVGTERGASYNESEYAAWLGEAGFREVHRIGLPGPSGLMIACVS